MCALSDAGRLDVHDDLVVERERFVALLGELSPDEWSAPTECPEWDVRGVALHVLGDDLSLLSRQRDQTTDGITLLSRERPGLDFRALLNAFNEAWVHRARFIGTPLLTDLLRVTGGWTADFYGSVPPDELGEPVPFVGPDPAPYWMIAAREYLERWVHHCQIARATDRQALDRSELLLPAVAAVMRGFPYAMSGLAASAGTTLTLEVDSTAWTVRRDDDRWSLHDGAPERATVRVGLTRAQAAALFSKGLGAEEIMVLDAAGDAELASGVLAGLAAVFAQTS